MQLLVAGRDPGVPDERTAADRGERVIVEFQRCEVRSGRHGQDCARKGHSDVVRHSDFSTRFPDTDSGF
jgi:hypothetical protein